MATSPAPDAAAPPGMCPGIAVLGGGGAGGDGDGDGSGGKDGSGGNGNGNGDGTGGDGKGAGNCGSGSSGGCGNCGHRVAAGDPVDVSTGEVLTIPVNDLWLPGRFDLTLVRSYASSRRAVDVGLGHGWCHSLGWRLRVTRKVLDVTTGDGRRFELPALTEDGSIGVFGKYTVIRRGPLYVIYPGNEFAHVFRERESSEGKYREYELRWIRYRNRGELSLDYDRGRLARVTDTVGREIVFAGGRDGRISGISVTAPGGARIDFAHFAHDARGDLVAATDANGHTTRFAYGDDHELTRIEYATGLVFHFKYDLQRRCIESWGEYPGRVDPALAKDLPRLLADGTTRTKGIYHCKLDFGDQGYTEVADAIRVRRFFSTPEGLVDKAVGGRGDVTSRAFDDEQNCIEQIDANGATWKWEYDRLGNPTRAVDPLGAEIAIERNLLSQEVAITDQEGARTVIERDVSGEMTRVVMPNGAENRFVLDERGATIAAYDARGGYHEFELDAHANRTAHKFPNGAKYRFEYDHWGRLTKLDDLDGRPQIYTYAPGGQITSLTDRLGRTRRFEYDALGKMTRELEEDGSAHTFEYGGLGWLCCSRWGDGAEVKSAYNTEGRIVQLTNERGESFEYTYDSDLRLAEEKDYRGRVTRYGCDALGRIIWTDDGRGKTEYTRDAVGRVVEAVAPDGAALSYAYDRRGSLKEATSSDGVDLKLTMDANGWVVGEELSFEQQAYAVETRRDVASDRSRMRTSLGHDLAWQRDINGLVTELGSPEGRVLSLLRNAGGQVVRRELDRGGAMVDEWDAESQLRRRQVALPGALAPAGEPAWVGVGLPGAREWLYDYSPVSELAKVSESSGRDVVFEYDVRGRLLERREGGKIESFAYDAASNLFERGQGAQARRYEQGDVLVMRGDVEYRYDDRGFLTEKVEHLPSPAAPNVTRYTWNGWGRLEAVDTPDGLRVEHLYDPFARRVAKRTLKGRTVVEAHHYVWDTVAMVHDVKWEPGKPSSDVTTYLYADGDDAIPIGQRDATRPGWVHYVADFNGVVEELMDGSGQSLGRLERTAFGRTRATPGSRATTPFRFAGQLEDKETGLHYNRARYYDPDIGRYISPDPKGIYGLVGLNLYAYCPNPIAWTDPGGLQHALTVTGSGVPLMTPPVVGRGDPSSGSLAYHAGRGGNADPNRSSPPLPGGAAHPLWPTAATHSEQRFAHDLITQANTPPPGRFTGQNFNLRSEGNMPPCPSCHAAMMRAAQVSGASVNYSWGTPPSVVNYAGGTGAPSVGAGGGTAAAPLLAAYGHTDQGTFTGAPNPNMQYPQEAGGVNRPTQAWGYNIPPSAWNHYNATK